MTAPGASHQLAVSVPMSPSNSVVAEPAAQQIVTAGAEECVHAVIAGERVGIGTAAELLDIGTACRCPVRRRPFPWPGSPCHAAGGVEVARPVDAVARPTACRCRARRAGCRCRRCRRGDRCRPDPRACWRNRRRTASRRSAPPLRFSMLQSSSQPAPAGVLRAALEQQRDGYARRGRSRSSRCRNRSRPR